MPLLGPTVRSVAFWVAALAGAGVFWLAEHPPMADLPAHAGQVALLRDLLTGNAHWAGEMRLNWLTPYLIGYGLALPLSLVLPVGAALKLLLSLSFLAFVLLCVRLARHFGSDPRLDILFPVAFFGVSYRWGFFTFLVAAPLALGFILAASRHARAPSMPRALALMATGAALFASHGLAFVFGWTVGLALFGAEWWRARAPRAAAGWPYAALALAFVACVLGSRAMEASFGPQGELWMDYQWSRLLRAPLYALGESEDKYLFLPLLALLLALPFAMGLRLRWSHWRGMVPLAVVLVFLYALPSFAFVGYVYERFGLYLLPAFAWAFPAAPARTVAPLRAGAAMGVLGAACAFVLAVQCVRAWRFGAETKAPDAALRALAPGARGLSLVFDPASAAASDRRAYLHYAAWYQAERGGLVDFNFAWFPPQIVRFRPDRVPAVAPGFEWRPHTFDWARHDGGRYRYFFVRGEAPRGLFRGAPCAPARIYADGAFSIYERRHSCAGK